MCSGSNVQKDEMTVGKLIELLSKYDKNAPVYFGAKIEFSTYYKDYYGYEIEHTAEFDDWLEFKETKISTQAYGKRGEVKIRPVLSIELKY